LARAAVRRPQASRCTLKATKVSEPCCRKSTPPSSRASAYASGDAEQFRATSAATSERGAQGRADDPPAP
jgi:hypothetical protein